MGAIVNIGSTNEWQSLLSGTNVVVADFYADWCGPCKMIAPHYERLAKEHSSPKKMAFAKVNVDTQSSISRTLGVTAMPTFKIFHNGSCVETIKGANPSALAAAVGKAAQLSSGEKQAGELFKTPGRTLGGDNAESRAASFDVAGLFRMIAIMVGLYLISLFSIDGYKAAEGSMFNIHRPSPPPGTAKSGKSGANGTGAAKPPAKPAFRTLADLGGSE